MHAMHALEISKISQYNKTQVTWCGDVANAALNRIIAGKPGRWEASANGHEAEPAQDCSDSLKIVIHQMMADAIHSHHLHSKLDPLMS